MVEKTKGMSNHNWGIVTLAHPEDLLEMEQRIQMSWRPGGGVNRHGR